MPSLLGVSLCVFVLVRLIPGDPVLLMMGERGLDPVFYQAALTRLGLDRPLPVQFLHYLQAIAAGDLGQSLVSQMPVWDEFRQLFPATLELTLCALLLASVLGLLIGIVAALWRGQWIDHLLTGAALTGYSMPIFWWGLMLIMLFSVQLGWTPVSGRIDLAFDVPVRTGFMLIDSLFSPDEGAWRSALAHLVLPGIVLATIPLAVIARMTRSALLDVLREDYIRAARARGLSPVRIILRYALRNALLPIVTVVGLQLGGLLAGAVLTETLFSWPGVGKWLIDAIGRRDYPVVQGGILLIAVLMIAVNLVVDLLYAAINPRIRHARS